MSADPLQILWRASEVASPSFTGDEVSRWPPETFDALSGNGLVVEGRPARYVICDACDVAHVEEVLMVSYPNRPSQFYISCLEHGRAEVDRDRVCQWAVRFGPLSRFLGEALGCPAPPEEVVPGRLWGLGRSVLAGRSRPIWMARGLSWPDAGPVLEHLPEGRSPVLLLLGRPPVAGLIRIPPDSVVELRTVLTVADGGLSLDRGTILSQLGETSLEPRGKQRRKRARRDEAIGALKKVIRDHLRAARDYAEDLLSKGKDPVLLPRPTQEMLASQLNLSRSTVSRALRDRSDRELLLLWRAANDLDQVLNHRR